MKNVLGFFALILLFSFRSTDGNAKFDQVSIYGENNHGVSVTVQLHNNSSQQDYFFTIQPHDSGMYADVPSGSYDITLTPNTTTGWYNYLVGCNNEDNGPGAMTFYSIGITTNCNNVLIN